MVVVVPRRIYRGSLSVRRLLFECSFSSELDVVVALVVEWRVDETVVFVVCCSFSGGVFYPLIFLF